MLPLLLLRFASAAGDCDISITPGTHFEHYTSDLIPGVQICINYSTLPSYVIFSSLPENTVVHQYRSFLDTQKLSLFMKYQVPNIPRYIYEYKPFASMTISLPTGGRVQFIHGNALDMCATGLHVIASVDDTVELSSEGQGSNLLSYDEDRCILNAMPGLQDIWVNTFLPEYGARLFIYGAYPLPITIGTLGSFVYSFNATKIVPLVRYKSIGQIRLSRFSIRTKTTKAPVIAPYSTIITLSNHSTNIGPDHHDCKLTDVINFRYVFIWAFFIFITLLLLFLTVFGISACTCPRWVMMGEEVQFDSRMLAGAVSIETRSELNGIFLMDPILRHNSD